MSVDQVNVADRRLDPEKMIFEGVTTDGEKDPHFTVSECAKFFFGRSPHWIRWLEQQHKLVLDGKPTCPHYKDERVVVPIKKTAKAPVKKVAASKRAASKTAAKEKAQTVRVSWLVNGKCKRCGGKQVGVRKTESGMRDYTLSDIEEMAHALAQTEAISGSQLSNALIALQASGKIWGKIS